jgi:hypothetical protein
MFLSKSDKESCHFKRADFTGFWFQKTKLPEKISTPVNHVPSPTILH